MKILDQLMEHLKMMEGNKLKKKLDAKMEKKGPPKGIVVEKVEIEKEDPEEEMMGEDKMAYEDGAMEKMKKDDEEEMKESSEYEYKADLGSLFEGTEFSEEFRQKAAEIFEAAVTVRVREEVAKLQEEISIRALQESEELKEGLTDKVDGYLNYMVEQWMQNNELALDRGIRAELFESFITGMKGLFEQHYVNLPDDSVDVLQQALEANQALEAKLNEATEQLVEFSEVLRGIEKRDMIAEAAEDLSDIDAERFAELAEELSFEDGDTFKGKLGAIRESFFTKKKAKPLTESIVSDEPVTLTEDAPKKQIDPAMQAYLSAIKPLVK